MIDQKHEYWAASTNEDLIKDLHTRVYEYDQYMLTTGMFTRMVKAMRMYFGYTVEGYHASSEVTLAGESGEMTLLKVNDFRNVLQHLIVLTTSQRPVLDTRAINSDFKSQVSAILGQKIIDHYMREKGVEDFLKEAVEIAVVLGECWLGTFWDANKGKEYGVDQTNPDQPQMVYDGDTTHRIFTPFHVIRDPMKKHIRNSDWIITRSFMNKYDLAATYPEKADEIMSIDIQKDPMLEKFNVMPMYYCKTDDVPMYEFFHKRTPSVPNGRCTLFLDAKIGLRDGDLPYRDIPVRRIASNNMFDTPFGYATAFDLLGLQEMSDGIYSILATNISTFGIQNIWMRPGDDVNYSSLADGLGVIECEQKPEPLQLTASSPEAYQFLTAIGNKISELVGIDDVTMGRVPEGVKSGSALAMLASTAIQRSSGLQSSYSKLCEDVASDIIYCLQDFAQSKRTITLVGENNRGYIKDFTAHDLNGVARVVADLGNPLSRTTAGKLQLADSLSEKGLIKTADEYIGVLKTGQLDSMTEGAMSQQLLVKDENEMLTDQARAQDVLALAIDNHPLHIQEHSAILAQPDIRKDPRITQAVLGHIYKHYELMSTTDPNLLALIGVTPLPPQNMLPPGAPPAGPAAPVMDKGATPMNENMPKGPRMPTNPLTGEQVQAPPQMGL